MKRFTFLVALLLCFATSAHAADNLGRLGECERWSGGTFTEEHPKRWRNAGYGVEFTYRPVSVDDKHGATYVPLSRYQEKEHLDTPIEWSPWRFVEGLLDGEDDAIVYITGAVWILHLENGQLVGTQLMLPVVRDRETGRPKSLVPDGELGLILECIRKQ